MPIDQTYQNMTTLPEALERKLLAQPLPVLLKACQWAGAAEKYTCVKWLARVRTVAQLEALADSKYSEEDVAEFDKLQREQLKKGKHLPPAGVFLSEAGHKRIDEEFAAKAATGGAAPKPKAADVMPKDPNAHLLKVSMKGVDDSTVVRLGEGFTKLAHGSARLKLLEHLRTLGGRATIAELTKKLGAPAKPVVAKLVAVGWVKLSTETDKKGKTK